MRPSPALPLLEISVRSHPSDSELIAHILSSVTRAPVAILSVSETEIEIRTYRPAVDDGNEIVKRLYEEWETAQEGGWLSSTPKLQIRLLESTGLAQDSLPPPLEVGDSLTIVMDPRIQLETSRTVVVITGAGGFGTGHHPSTRLCLRLLEKCPIENRDLLDVGTGSGILAIAAAKWGARTVVAADIDPLALESARWHARLNAVEDRIRFVRSDLARQIVGRFDGIVSNLSAEMVEDLSYQIYSKNLLQPGGFWIGAGFLIRDWAALEPVLRRLPFLTFHREEEEDWAAFLARA